MPLDVTTERFPDKGENVSQEKILLHQLYERSAAICVLRQRVEILLQVPSREAPCDHCVDDHRKRPPRAGRSLKSEDMYKPHELGDRDALVAYIARLSGSTKRQASVLNLCTRVV